MTETPNSPWSGIQREGGNTGMPRFPWSGITKTVTGRRLLIQGAIVFTLTLGGYLLAALWLYPAPLFSEAVGVPRVLELTADEAEARLTGAGLRVKRERELPHPTQPRGNVVFQEPSPYSIVGPGATVELILSGGPPEFAIPDIEGIDASIATRVLQASGLTIRRTDSVANALPKGVALTTRPAAGITRPASDPIDLVVSAGPASSAIPDVTGLTIQEARERLFPAGFNVGRIVFERSEGLPAGQVIRQRPAAGVLTAKDDRVDLVVVGEPE
jgi:beta-lactam-binding protein with PASTA domain